MIVKNKTIVWIINRLSDVGGGEKLLLEGVKYYRSIGYTVKIITWEFNERVLLDGKYEYKDITLLEENIIERVSIFKRAFNRFKSISKLRRFLKDEKPELVIAQGEYDVAVLYVATIFTKIKYAFLIFGQTYQYPHDIAKYSLIFKKHLSEIISSQQGYKETIPLKRPETSLANILTNEIVCLIRYFAVRKSVQRFTFSKSVQWETKKLFNSDTTILKGAFPKAIFKEDVIFDFQKTYKIPQGKKIIMSFSRLDIKKRVDVVINSMKYLSEDYILCIGGKGQDFERLKSIANQMDLNDRIYFLGFIPESHANALKKACDIFVSMDIGDFDISPFEALALGKKVILPTEFDMDEKLSSFKNIFVTRAESKVLSQLIPKAIEAPTFPHEETMSEYTWESYFSNILKYSLLSEEN